MNEVAADIHNFRQTAVTKRKEPDVLSRQCLLSGPVKRLALPASGLVCRESYVCCNTQVAASMDRHSTPSSQAAVVKHTQPGMPWTQNCALSMSGSFMVHNRT